MCMCILENKEPCNDAASKPILKQHTYYCLKDIYQVILVHLPEDAIATECHAS